MSRVADSDLNDLATFIDAYRVPSDLGAQARSLLLKRGHRHVLAALQIWERFSSDARSGSAFLHSVRLDASSDVFEYIGEYFSDLVCVLACAIHGLYKPANMQLRSSIESLVRGVAGLTSLESKETKSVYRLFELAAMQKPFRDSSATDFALLQQVYGEQCLYVHSATPDQRAGVHHVASHMRQDTNQLRQLIIAVEKVNRASLSILVRADKRLYTTCSPRVRDLLDEVLPKEVRLFALGGV